MDAGKSNTPRSKAKPKAKAKLPSTKKDSARKRGGSQKKDVTVEPKDSNAGTVIYEVPKNALGPPSPPLDPDAPLEDLPPPDEVRIRARQHETVSVVDTPLVIASVTNGIFTFRLKKRKRDGELDNEFISRLMHTKTDDEFRATLSDSVQGAADKAKAAEDAVRAAPKQARKRRRRDKAKRALDRLAEMNMDEDELAMKREDEEYEGGDEADDELESFV